MRKIKKAEFSFEWLFAIIAGGIILILAIYGATKIGNTQRYLTDTEVAKKIAILTDPLQAGFASSSMGKIIFNQETRIDNVCYAGGFGRNVISVASYSGVGEGWVEQGAGTSIYNKYIFSDNAQGKEFYVFSAPFKMPYKVADMTFLISEKYCFVFDEASESFEDELMSFKTANIQIANSSSECGNATKVCFGSGNCDINVHGSCVSDCEKGVYTEGYVDKNQGSFAYSGNLIYAAIFSDKGVYDCNVQRLLYRTGKIAEVFADKADLMNARGCNTNLKADLLFLATITSNADVNDLTSIAGSVKLLDKQNSGELCRIW